MNKTRISQKKKKKSKKGSMDFFGADINIKRDVKKKNPWDVK